MVEIFNRARFILLKLFRRCFECCGDGDYVVDVTTTHKNMSFYLCGQHCEDVVESSYFTEIKISGN